MAKITLMDNTHAYHVFQPSDSRRWISYRVNALGCEIAEYEDLGSGEVKKYPLAHYKEYQWVKQDKQGLEGEVIKTPSRNDEPPVELDKFTKKALEERGEDTPPDYASHLKKPDPEDDIPTSWPTKEEDPVEQYDKLKAASDAKKPKGKCQHCDTQFIKGHPSKKFCDSKCKDAFHNSKRNKTTTVNHDIDEESQTGGHYDYPKD